MEKLVHNKNEEHNKIKRKIEKKKIHIAIRKIEPVLKPCNNPSILYKSSPNLVDENCSQVKKNKN